MTAARKGEAFVVETGHPTSMHREEQKVRWLDFAMEYVDMKWAHLAPNSRRNTARALTNATLALIDSNRGRPNDNALRRTLDGWVFNSRTRQAGDPPADVAKILNWIADNSRDVSDLGEAAVTRGMLNAIAKLADGREP